MKEIAAVGGWKKIIRKTDKFSETTSTTSDVHGFNNTHKKTQKDDVRIAFEFSHAVQ